MTPAARVAAAIEVLDAILCGTPAEAALTRWARASRFAGSKDRAALRDHVFSALRNLQSFAARGGQPLPGTTGRAVMIGALREEGACLVKIFNGQGHAPPPLSKAESVDPGPVPEGQRWNVPPPVQVMLQDSLGTTEAFETAQALRTRAPVTLRVNLSRCTRQAAQAQLAAVGIDTRINPLAEAALTVTEGARQVHSSMLYRAGDIELQDASSQAVVEAVPLSPGMQVIDFCAGGGGKALGLAMRTGGLVWAHDIDPARMRDLPERARRAGAQIRLCSRTEDLPQADLVLADAPCSGSGAWRRTPDAKWRFTAERLAELTGMQDAVLNSAARHVAPGGCLAYATCSVLREENAARVAGFLAGQAGWDLVMERRWMVTDEGDGFFLSLLKREK